MLSKKAPFVLGRLLATCLGFMSASLAWGAGTEEDAAGLRLKATGFAEFGLHYSRLTQSNPSWGGQYARVVWSPEPTLTWYGELSHQRRFGGEGWLATVGATQVWNDDWYGSLFAASSSGGEFLPKYRVDASISRKWLERRNLVTSLGLGSYRARDVHKDASVDLSARYYFDAPWIAEVGARSNWSDPGAVRAVRGRAVLTWGRDRKAYLTLRHEAGREAYQIVGPQTVLSNFSSRETSLTWRQWITAKDGFNLWLVHYDNPYYSRKSMEAGWFHGF